MYLNSISVVPLWVLRGQSVSYLGTWTLRVRPQTPNFWKGLVSTKSATPAFFIHDGPRAEEAVLFIVIAGALKHHLTYSLGFRD